jgi:nucleotide-binding universal stress UspA family protein
MRWIVGLDLRPRSAGALHFASWLADATAPRDPDTFVAVHVLEGEHLRAVLRTHHLDEVAAAARAQVTRTLEAEGPGGRVRELDVRQAPHADEGLAAARAAHDAGGMVIGRIARREEQRILRLGRVARRLLRAQPCPLVVVPPDVGPAQLGDGPVVALTSLEDDAVTAARFAAGLARRLGRVFELLHVVPHLSAHSPEFLPVAALDERSEELVAEGQKGLAAWVKAHDLAPDRSTVLRGELFEVATLHAERERAPLLVVGGHRRGALERYLTPSIGGELAATATVPVAVVPQGP